MLKKYSRPLDLILCGIEAYRRGQREVAARMFVRAASHPGVHELATTLDRANQVAMNKNPTFAKLVAKAAMQLSKKGKKAEKADAEDDLDIEDLDLDEDTSGEGEGQDPGDQIEKTEPDSDNQSLVTGDPLMNGDLTGMQPSENEAGADEKSEEESADEDKSEEESAEDEKSEEESADDEADEEEADDTMMGADGFGENGVEAKAKAQAKLKAKAKVSKSGKGGQQVAHTSRNLLALSRLAAQYLPRKSAKK